MKLSRLMATLALTAVLGTSLMACSAPSTTTPAATTPAATKPATTTPAPTTPAPITPAPTKPVATTPAPTTPAPTTTAPTTHPVSTTGFTNPGLLVDVKWLNDHSADANLVIIDTRSASDYASGHIKNSINLPPATFSGPSVSGINDPTDLISAQDMAAILGQLRISNKSKIVLYGIDVGYPPARIFWALEILGHTDVHILNGGYTSWKAANYAVTTDTSRPMTDTATFVVNLNEKPLAKKAHVLANYNNPGYVIVDSRDAKDWLVKRIPGAINILTSDYLNADGTVKSFDELTAFLKSKGVTPDKTVITMCYVGYRSSQAYFIFRMLGYNVSNYDGSATEWFADSTLPFEPK